VTTRQELSDLAYRLILRAAHNAPELHSERLREEWLAELEYRSGSLCRLRFAIGCSWATAVIAREFRLPAVRTVRGVGRYKSLLGELSFDLSARSRHALTFVVLASFQGFFLARGFEQLRSQAISSTEIYLSIDDASMVRTIPEAFSDPHQIRPE